MTLGRPFFYDSVEKPSPFVKTIHGEITAVDKEIFLKKNLRNHLQFINFAASKRAKKNNY